MYKKERQGVIWLKAETGKLWQLRGFESWMCPLCWGRRRHCILLKCWKAEKWCQFICRKSLNANGNIPYETVLSSTEVIWIKNTRKHLFKVRCRLEGKAFEAIRGQNNNEISGEKRKDCNGQVITINLYYEQWNVRVNQYKWVYIYGLCFPQEPGVTGMDLCKQQTTAWYVKK